MPNLIDRDEVLKLFDKLSDIDIIGDLPEKILSIPLQQGGNDKIKDLIEKKIKENESIECDPTTRTILILKNESLKILLSEIDNLPPNQ